MLAKVNLIPPNSPEVEYEVTRHTTVVFPAGCVCNVRIFLGDAAFIIWVIDQLGAKLLTLNVSAVPPEETAVVLTHLRETAPATLGTLIMRVSNNPAFSDMRSFEGLHTIYASGTAWGSLHAPLTFPAKLMRLSLRAKLVTRATMEALRSIPLRMLIAGSANGPLPRETIFSLYNVLQHKYLAAATLYICRNAYCEFEPAIIELACMIPGSYIRSGEGIMVVEMVATQMNKMQREITTLREALKMAN